MINENKSISEIRKESNCLQNKIKDLNTSISELNSINYSYETGESYKRNLDELTNQYEEKVNNALKINYEFDNLKNRYKNFINDINLIKAKFNNCVETLLKINEYKTNFDYNKVRHILNNFDKSIFEYEKDLKSVATLKQMYYFSLSEVISRYGSSNKLKLTDIDEYLDVVKKLENFKEGVNKNFYIEDACRNLLIVLNDNLLTKDLFQMTDFNLYHSYFVTLKEYKSLFSEDTIMRYKNFEAKMVSWFNKISHNAFDVQQDISKAVSLFLLKDVFDQKEITVKAFKECKNEDELRNLFEQNVISTCSPQQMENIISKAILKKDEFNAHNIAVILKSKYIQLDQIDLIMETLDNKLTSLQKWEIVDLLINEYESTTHREVIEALISLTLKKKYYKMYLPKICHYLFISYQYTERNKTRDEIVKFSQRIFASPKVYRDRYKLDGYEVMQIYRISRLKKVNKKDGFNYLGESSDIVEGVTSFIPKNKNHIILLKSLVFIAMALILALAVASAVYFKIDIFDYKLYMVGGVTIGVLGLLITFYIVYFNSYDELKAIIARYSIYAILILGTIAFSVFYFSSISPRFNANVYNISITCAIVGAVLNFLSYFYINKNEKPILKLTFIITSTLCAIYLIAMMVYIVLTFR